MNTINEKEVALDDIVNAIGDASLMDMRKPLETVFKKKDIDFAMSPIAHYRIKTPKGTLIIVNKKYVEKPDKVFGTYAIGYDG